MVAYRFCRPDDIPELVAAVNRCYDVHFSGEAFTVDGFRREMRELQLWPSNSMLARAGDDAVAVVLGTKRSREVLVRRIGVAPGHQRQGYGRHLLDSLSHKLAVLGPPRLVAEVPAELGDARAFFAGAGWSVEGEMQDFVRSTQPADVAVGGELADRPPLQLSEIGVAELDAAGLLPPRADLAWERQAESLRGAPGLRGMALARGDEVAGWALFRPGEGGGADVLRLGFPGGEPAQLLRPLAAGVQDALAGPLRLLRLSSGELPAALLAALGFVAGAAFVRFAAVAEAA